MTKFPQEITLTIVTSATGSTWGRQILSKTFSISDDLIYVILAILAVLRTLYREWLFGLREVTRLCKEGYYGLAQEIGKYSLIRCAAVIG